MMEHSEVELLAWDAARCGDLVLLGDGDALAAAAGPAVLLTPLSAAAPARRLPVRDGFGIGALAADAKRQYLAVLEKSCSSWGIAAKPNMCVLYARREEERGGVNLLHQVWVNTALLTQFFFLPPPHTHRYVYEWPSLALVATLADGSASADNAYTAAAFDSSGDWLATVGGAPGYALTLWRWRAGTVLLQAPGGGAGVRSVAFSQRAPLMLFTSGAGGLRAWRAVETFTGLKLQATTPPALAAAGGTGACAPSHASDGVTAVAELAGGDWVLTGGDSGQLVLRDGCSGAALAVVQQAGGAPCHAGGVTAICADAAVKPVITAGGDGFVRMWDASTFVPPPPPLAEQPAAAPPSSGGDGSNGAAVAGSSAAGLGAVLPVITAEPVAQIALLPGALPVALLCQSTDSLLVADATTGGLLKLAAAAGSSGAAASWQVDRLSGLGTLPPVVGFAALPGRHIAAAACADGSMRALDYRRDGRRDGCLEVCPPVKFGSPATCLALLPPHGGASGGACRVAVGFADGAVRALQLCSDGWALLGAQRPHAAAVVALAAAPDGRLISSVGADNTVFFLDTAVGCTEPAASNSALQPVGFVELPPYSVGDPDSSSANHSASCCWSADSARLGVGCATGLVCEIAAPLVPASIIDSGVSSGSSSELGCVLCTKADSVCVCSLNSLSLFAFFQPSIIHQNSQHTHKGSPTNLIWQCAWPSSPRRLHRLCLAATPQTSRRPHQQRSAACSLSHWLLHRKTRPSSSSSSSSRRGSASPGSS
jgi:hypothetical protein